MFKKVFVGLVVGLVGLAGICFNSHAEIYSSISGRVVDADTGEGIEGATFLMLKTKRKYKTDSNGFFQISKIRAGIHGYQVIPPENDKFYINNVPPQAIEVIYSKDITNLNIKLNRGARIEGKLFDSNNNILADTNVYAFAFNHENSKCDDYNTFVRSKTDEKGNFILNGLRTGLNIEVNITSAGIDRRIGELMLTSGEVLKKDFIMPNNGSQKILGKVVDSVLGTSLKNISVSIRDIRQYDQCPDKGFNIEIARSYTNENGEFSIINLRPGKYKLFFYDHGDNEYHYNSLTLSEVTVLKDIDVEEKVALIRKPNEK